MSEPLSQRHLTIHSKTDALHPGNGDKDKGIPAGTQPITCLALLKGNGKDTDAGPESDSQISSITTINRSPQGSNPDINILSPIAHNNNNNNLNNNNNNNNNNINNIANGMDQHIDTIDISRDEDDEKNIIKPSNPAGTTTTNKPDPPKTDPIYVSQVKGLKWGNLGPLDLDTLAAADGIYAVMGINKKFKLDLTKSKAASYDYYIEFLFHFFIFFVFFFYEF